jgi:hypothetical protein
VVPTSEKGDARYRVATRNGGAFVDDLARCQLDERQFTVVGPVTKRWWTPCFLVHSVVVASSLAPVQAGTPRRTRLRNTLIAVGILVAAVVSAPVSYELRSTTDAGITAVAGQTVLWLPKSVTVSRGPQGGEVSCSVMAHSWVGSWGWTTTLTDPNTTATCSTWPVRP